MKIIMENDRVSLVDAEDFKRFNVVWCRAGFPDASCSISDIVFET